MRLDFKAWSLCDLGNLLVVGIVLVILIAIMNLFISPLLIAVLPTVFTEGLSLVEILLFFILIRLVVHRVNTTE